jgi:hypothetical protein
MPPIEGARFLLKICISAIFLAGFFAVALERYTGLLAVQWLSPVAFLIGFFGDSWSSIGPSAADAARGFLATRFGGTPK